MIIIINGAILIFITNYCSNTFSISYSYLMTIVQDNTLVVIMHISGLLHSCVCLLVEKKIVLSLGVIALHRNENFVAVFAPVQISVPYHHHHPHKATWVSGYFLLKMVLGRILPVPLQLTCPHSLLKL